MLKSPLGRGAPIVAALIALGICAAPAAAKTKWADVRVLTHTGRTLAELRQYTGSVDVRASRKAECFGPDNPSTGKRYPVRGSTALGATKDAADAQDSLRPLLISDAFVDDGFGLGVCSIGGFETVGFSYWYLAINGVGATSGASQTAVRNGDEVLWYFTSGKEAGLPRELLLSAPAAAKPGKPFEAEVSRIAANGTSRPAGGVMLAANGDPVGRTTADGTLAVTLSRSATLKATGTKDDVPSNRARVCVSARASECPSARGARIYGSAHADEIDSTRGPDRIKSRGGADVVDLRSGGADRVSCGGGRDEVILERRDRDDQVAESCERVRRR